MSATDTDSANWTLQAQDLGGGAGHMVASAAGCSGSTAQLTDALQVSVSTSLSGVTFAPAISLTASPQTVATGSNASMLAPTLFTTSFSQALPSTEVLRTNCAYTITITFTLQ